MGLMDHRHLHNDSPPSRIGASVFIVLLWFFFLFLYIRNLIQDFHWLALVLPGIVLIFFFPFMVLGGIGEIVESVREIKEKKREEKIKKALESYLDSLNHEEQIEFIKGFYSKTQNDEENT